MNQKKPTHNAKVISFINMKGGVGKTTLCINTAENLSKKGHKVIILDLDPQFNATQAMLLQKNRLKKANEKKVQKLQKMKKMILFRLVLILLNIMKSYPIKDKL
ncbi:ParA family protein [Lactiplantibacillus plantarum]|nr:ParA family protein [Lactiplantibacillus plantarum]